MFKILTATFVATLVVGCSTSPVVRNIASDFNEYNDSPFRIEGLSYFFPAEQNSQIVSLVNSMGTDVMYRIVSTGNLYTSKNIGTCNISTDDFMNLPAGSQCTIKLLKGNKTNTDVDSELRVYKEEDSERYPSIRETVSFDSFTDLQCRSIIRSLHLYYTDVEGWEAYKYKRGSNHRNSSALFTNDCDNISGTKIRDLSITQVMDDCYRRISKDTLNNFRDSSGEFDARKYQDHLNKFVEFDVDTYCEE